jgi:integrase/recombinase XerC
MVSLFIQHLKYEKRSSPHTLTAYRTDLEQFELYLKVQYEFEYPQLADAPMVRSWVASLVQTKISTVSLNRKLATLRAFFKFVLKKGVISQNPMDKITSPKKPKKLPEFVLEKEMERLDNVEFSSDFVGQRDKLVIELLYGTGIRLAELIGLQDVSIDTYTQTIKVLGKRNKERIVPVPRETMSLIVEYQEIRNGNFEIKENYLILSDVGKKAYPMLIQRIVKRYLGYITTLEKKSPHTLRHTYATHLLNRGADLNAIKDLLGHTSLAATQVYTHNSFEQIKKIYEQAHPKA